MKDDAVQLELLITEAALKERVAVLGREISADYKGEHLHLVGLLKGAWVFTADLMRQLHLETSVDFIAVCSYASATRSRGRIEIVKNLETSIQGRHVLVVEDICDTGLTLDYLRQELWRHNPQSLRVASLLSKRARRLKPVDPEYIGFEIPDKFVVGYGLDYRERFRNLPSISAIVPHETELSDRKRA